MTSALQTKVDALMQINEREREAIDDILALAEALPTYSKKQEEYRALAKARREAPVPADAELLQTPADVVAALDDVLRTMRSLVFDMASLATYVVVKLPEMKEEDNAGVGVQSAMLDLINDVQRSLQGINKEAPRPIHLGSKQSYLTARFDLETKLAPTGEKDQPPKSPSLRLAIHELDATVLFNVAVAYADITKYVVAITTTFSRNVKKLQEPRRRGHDMIS